MKFVTNLGKGILGGPDSTELWQGITSYIPDSFLLKPDIKILSVAAGHGTEAVILAKRMLGLGLSSQQVKNAIWLIDRYKVFTNYAKFIHGFTHVITDDFMEWDPGMKFDVYLGNPPFQSTDESGDRKSKSTNLWSKFTQKGFDLVNDGGYVAMITPSSWAANTVDINQGKVKLFKDVFVKNNPVAINLHTVKDHFPGVGSTFSYFVVQKAPNQGSTELVTADGNKIAVDLRGFNNLPKTITKESISIDQKFAKLMTDNTTCQGQLQSKSCLYNEEKTKEFKYPAYHTPSVEDAGGTWYTNVPHPNMKEKKIIFSLSGYFRPYADDGKIGYTDMCLAYILKPGELLEAASQVFGSKLYKFYLENNKWSGFNPKEIIRSFPVLDLTRTWTDSDIYKHFRLTKSEIAYVEEKVKE